jgi:hypothetical protein
VITTIGRWSKRETRFDLEDLSKEAIEEQVATFMEEVLGLRK